MGWLDKLTNKITDIGSASDAISGIANSLFGEDGIFGHSSWYKTLKNGEAQNQVNQQMALWNMENVTKPVFQMENQEYDRRFAQQNAEWERQFNLQNEYNSPANQIARMRQAGQNPAGSPAENIAAAGGNVGNPTVNEAASAFAQPANLFEARIAEAQAKQMEANVFRTNIQNRLTEREIQEKEINNKTLAELNAGNVELLHTTIRCKASEEKLTYWERQKEKALIRQINNDCERILAERDATLQSIAESKRRVVESYYRQENLEAGTAKINQETIYQRELNKYAAKEKQAIIKRIMSETNKNYAEAETIFEQGKAIAAGREAQEFETYVNKYKWNAKGQFRIKSEGARMVAQWEDTPKQLATDRARREWQEIQEDYRLKWWVGDALSRGIMAADRSFTINQEMWNGREPATPSYQTKESIYE